MPEVLGIRVEFKLATISHGYKDVVEVLQDGNKTLGELLYGTLAVSARRAPYSVSLQLIR